MKAYTKEEEQEAFKIYQKDKSNLEDIVLHNTGLVYEIAISYTSQGLEFDDILSTGYEGLIHAINEFDLSYNCKFSTYASRYIIGYIKKEIYEQINKVHVPRHVVCCNRQINEYINNHDGEVHDEEIMKYLNISKTELLRSYYMYPEYAPLYIKQEDGTSYEIEIPSKEGRVTEDEVINCSLIDIIDNAKDVLKEREIEFIKLYFFDDFNLPEIAKRYNITVERTRQILTAAINKIRISSLVNELVPFTSDKNKSMESINIYREIIKYTGIGKKINIDNYPEIVSKVKHGK